ncbi:MAG TPA: alpha-amylase family glycosyl hydrolase [Kofleriaceae bacterium]|nr:alpha-amylase family glycosyl hydrolase [Kofleriaceae bacterium]
MPAPEPTTATVTVRARPQAPTAALELRGELPHWSVGHAMSPAGDGFELTLPLAPGVYAVKAQAPGGAWWIDPAWRTMHDGDVENGAIVVGGTDEPVLHAPAAPWLERADDGVIVVRAALRRTAKSRGLTVRIDEGAGVVARRMTAVDADASHVYFEARLPGAGRRLHYAFGLDDGRTVAAPGGSWLGVALHELPAPPPAWWRDAVVYTVLVDRFRRGGARGAWPAGVADAGASRVLGCADRAGGDLRGVTEALPYLADLGVTVVHLTPVCVAPSAHRYDAIDPRAVDPALGGEAAFARLVEAAHERGLRVVCDVAATHVHRDFAPFRDVLEHGPSSPYWPWFSIDRWPCSVGPDPGYAHYQKGQWQEPLLRTGEPAVADWIVETFTSWVRRGADGVRVDAAADLPLPLVARVRQAVRAVRADAIVFGEVVPACIDRFAPAALDAATDFATRETMVEWLAGRAPAADVARVFGRQRRRGAAGPRGLGFAGTHDQPRIASLTDAARARLALLAVTLGARTPLLYYGDEAGLAAGADAVARAFEDSWPDRQPMPWDEATWDATTRALVRDALALRRTRDVFRRGDEELRTDGACLVLRRGRGDEVVELVLHRGDEPTTVALPPGSDARVLLAIGGACLDGDVVHLPPASAIVLDRTPPATPHVVELRTRNGELAAHAFVEGAVDLPTYPRRLNLTVTEACNLRCQHCITDAPARTREGRARTAPPWLLAALADAFAHAEHIAFTHGGESLASPALFDVLRAIARARAGATHRLDLHLATNGMLLDGDRLRALVDLGVTSLMVSVDGATPATNDRIRVLGDLHRVLDHVAGAVAYRERTGADLRVGLSTVLGRANVREMAALGRTAVSLGVDWLKIEETYAVNGFSRADALAPDAADVADAMAALRDAVAGSSLTLVDHLAPPAACTCSDDARTAATVAFRAADDFAHRARFRPCRAAWEAAAIDPDGVVHLVDHAGAALGSLLDASFLELWNAPAAIAARTSALAASPRDQRLACITRDR